MNARKRKKDDKGMTLIEVIVAVAIFSIAAIILMQGFVTSGRINRKSNLYMEATSTAQNVMEELKAMDFEETALAFNYPLDLTFSGGGFSRFHFLEDEAGKLNQTGGITVRELIKRKEDNRFIDAKLAENGGQEGDAYSASILSENRGRSYIFNPKESGTYYFEILNVTNQRETFDVLVTFDGKMYKKMTAAEEDEMNDYELPQISKLDNVKNGFLAMDKIWGVNFVNNMRDMQLKYAKDTYQKDKGEWEKAYPLMGSDGKPVIDENGKTVPDPAKPFPEDEPKLIDLNEFCEQLDRKLIVELSEEDGNIQAKSHYELKAFGCKDKTQQNCKYATFSICPCNGAQTGEDDCFCTRISMPETIYKSESDAVLENLYLFYYPNYASAGGEILDSIEFINEINHSVNLYIAKQIQEGENLSANENSYKMSLIVKEKPSEDPDNTWYTNPEHFQAKTHLRTDLNTDISKQEVADREVVPEQIDFSYGENSAYGDYFKKVTGDVAERILVTNGLENRERSDRIYKVTVDVYKKGARETNFSGEPVVELVGSRED